jgi:hypothetical protein
MDSIVHDGTSASLDWQNSVLVLGRQKRQDDGLVSLGAHVEQVVAWAQNNVVDGGLANLGTVNKDVLNHVTNGESHDRRVWNVD